MSKTDAMFVLGKPLNMNLKSWRQCPPHANACSLSQRMQNLETPERQHQKAIYFSEELFILKVEDELKWDRGRETHSIMKVRENGGLH